MSKTPLEAIPIPGSCLSAPQPRHQGQDRIVGLVVIRFSVIFLYIHEVYKYIRTVVKPSPIRPHASSLSSTRVGAKPGTKIKLIKQRQTHNFRSDILQRNEFQILPTKAWLSGGTDTAWVAMAAAGLRAGSVTAKETPWLLVHVKSL